MNLLFQASMRKIRAEFAGNVQPSESTTPNDMNKQMAGNTPGNLSDDSLKQIRSYREYKKKEQEKKAKGKKRKAPTPVMPESLKKDIRRAKTIKQDDIAPTV